MQANVVRFSWQLQACCEPVDRRLLKFRLIQPRHTLDEDIARMRSTPLSFVSGDFVMNKRFSLLPLMTAVIVALAMTTLLGIPAALAQGQKVLKFIPQADLRILDPITTTAYITRNHGYMIYDTLFATDAKFQVQPQMIDKYELSKDQLTYTFTLRDGLKFHDGQPVRSADCIASIERWAKRDALGQKMAEATESWKAVNDKTFTLKLKRPFPLALEALAKPSSNVPFIMPERIAKTGIDEHHGAYWLRPLQVRKRGMGSREQGDLCQERRLRTAQRTAVMGGRRQGRQGRSCRMDLHPGLGDSSGCAQRGRGRLVGADAAGLDSGIGEKQGDQGREHRSAGLDGHDPFQFSISALQQREDARGASLRRRPE